MVCLSGRVYWGDGCEVKGGSCLGMQCIVSESSGDVVLEYGMQSWNCILLI